MNDLGNKGYLVFGLILFVWELLPTTLLVGFFRVHRPPQDLVGLPTTSWSSVEAWTLGILVWGPGTVWGAEKISIVATSSPIPYRAPVESSMGRFLAPDPTSLTGLATVRMRAAPGSIAEVRAPGRSFSPA